MFQKIYAVLAAILVFISATAISASADLSPTSLRSEGSAACRKVRTEFDDPRMMPWNKRMVYWLCYPEYIDPR